MDENMMSNIVGNNAVGHHANFGHTSASLQQQLLETSLGEDFLSLFAC